jgi:hypothetical protein
MKVDKQYTFLNVMTMERSNPCFPLNYKIIDSAFQYAKLNWIYYLTDSNTLF